MADKEILVGVGEHGFTFTEWLASYRSATMSAPVGYGGERELLVKLEEVLRPLDSKIDFALRRGSTEAQMREDLSYMRGLLAEAVTRIQEVLDA